MYFRAILIWILFSILAILNGLLRNMLITPQIGERAGHIVSTAIFCVIIFFVTWLLIKWIGPKNRNDALAIGMLWILMTVAFEFIAGHYLFGHSWEKLFADYNVARGRFWVFVLISTYFAPRWSAKIRKIY